MDLKQVVVSNGGMSQDLSVSKQENKLAFENKNIRIQATDDGTLLSVTNIKSPKDLLGTKTIPMSLYGSCVTPDYLVLFGNNGTQDCIYRVTLSTLDSGAPKIDLLYNGNLNFSPSAYIDTLYYEEGEKVKKIYWTDGINGPRVINIIAPIEREGGVIPSDGKGYDKNVFEFYPNAYTAKVIRSVTPHGKIIWQDKTFIPKIEVEKNRTVTSEIPSGVIQYFVSYYWLNGAETLIAAASDTYTVDYSNRGAKADEVGMCAFDIKIPSYTVNPNFDYMRVYSAVRTTYNGPLTVKIVGDIKINPDFEGDYTITDNGINQEQLADTQLYFIGGTPFIAKTLTEKDNTLFLGNVTSDQIEVTDELKELIKNECATEYLNGEVILNDAGEVIGGTPDLENENNEKWWVKNGVLDFRLTKSVPATPNQFDSYYPYKLQLDKGSSSYKTFKSGEIYRFGIQFQTPKGTWTAVIWIGDKECSERPVYEEETQTFKLNNAEFKMPKEVARYTKELGFTNYRLVIANAETSNGRKIKAQGILNPTLFTPGQRAIDSPYALPSWIIRPRKGLAAYHHFEPLFSTEVEGSELASYTPGKQKAVETFDIQFKDNNNLTVDAKVTVDSVEKSTYTTPYKEFTGNENIPRYIVTCLSISPGNQLRVRIVDVHSEYAANNFYDADGNEPLPASDINSAGNSYEILCDYTAQLTGDDNTNNKYNTALNAVYDGEDRTKRCTWYDDGLGTIYEDNYIEAFERIGLDKRLIPGPKLLNDIAKALISDYAKMVAQWIFAKVAETLILLTASATLGILGPGFAALGSAIGASTIAVSSGPMFAGLGLGNIASAKTMEAISDKIHKNPFKPSSGVLISQSTISDILGNGYDDLKSFQKEMLSLRFMPLYQTRGSGGEYTRRGNTADRYSRYTAFENIIFSSIKDTYTADGIDNPTIPQVFKPMADTRDGKAWESGDSSEWLIIPNWDQVATFIQVFPVSANHDFTDQFKKEYNNYYIDESWLSLDSPELIDNPLTAETINFRAVGVAPITSNYVDASIKVNKSFADVDTGLDYAALKSFRNDSSFYPLYSEYLYMDAGWFTYTPEGQTEEVNELNIAYPSRYKIHLFSPNNYLGAISPEELGLDPETVDIEFPGNNEKQQILNHNFSNITSFFTNPVDYGNVYYAQVNEEDTDKAVRTISGLVTYNPKYENLIIDNISHQSLPINPTEIDTVKDKVAPGNVSLKFSSSPHVVLNLQQKLGERFILPTFTEKIRYIFYCSYSDDMDNYVTPTHYVVYRDHVAVEVPWEGVPNRHDYVKTSEADTHIDSLLVDYTKKYSPNVIYYGSNNNRSGFRPRGGNSVYKACIVEDAVPLSDYYRTISDAKVFVWEDTLKTELSDTVNINIVPLPPIQDRPGIISTIMSSYDNTTQHAVAGMWKQNAKNTKEAYSIWDNNEKYHCGAYFILEENNNIDYSSGISSISSSIISDTILLKLGSSILNGILLASVYNSCYTEEWKEHPIIDTYTVSVSSETPIVIGYYKSEVVGSVNKLSTIKFRVKNFTVDVSWDSAAGQYKFNYRDFTADTVNIPDEEDVYLQELDAEGRRFKFRTVYEKTVSAGQSPKEDYNDFSIHYEAPIIGYQEEEPSEPYLFIGELYQNIPHKDLYGGTEEHHMRRLSWYPISKSFPIKPNSKIEETEGDTYYQRWDCLKTYPTTEEDINQVVDITSFMVETHKNLDSRSDINRATYNLMSRPTNFNLFNPVYNQPNNIFEYTTDWSDLDSSVTPNRITWSMAKNLFGDVDTWTNVTLENSTRTKYPVTKLVNWNNQVLALTEHSLELVNFNAKNLVPSTDNSFIELQNSNKVDGTTKLQNPYGSYNMSTLITEQGFYFIEDNEKSIIRINGEGPKKIGITKLTDWLHNNIIQGTHTNAKWGPIHFEYDGIHKDVYLVKESDNGHKTCLVYNELLDEFTSFLTYSGDYWLFNYGGNFYAYKVASASDPVELHKMFAGNSYNKDFGETNNLEYSVSYAINPNAYTDKVFTNGILVADLATTGTDIEPEYPNSTKDTAIDETDFPFSTVRAWTEHQDTGDVELKKILDRPSNLKQKFRFWKFFIPRDAKTKTWPRNRIRNPWMRIKLTGNSDKKMEFHNMTIQYME